MKTTRQIFSRATLIVCLSCLGFGYTFEDPATETNGWLADASFSGTDGFTMARFYHLTAEVTAFVYSEGRRASDNVWVTVQGSKSIAVTDNYLLAEYYWNSYYNYGRSKVENADAGRSAEALVY